MKKILVVDNTIDPPHGSPEIVHQLEQRAQELGGLSITAVRGPQAAIPDNAQGYDAVVLSGSKTRIFEDAPWIEKEISFIKKLYNEKVPTLGICYGEQMIVRALTGKDWEEYTGASKISEYGWGKMQLTQDAAQSGLMHSLPQEFYSYCMHSDEVYKLPKNFRLTAKSEDCPVQAFDLTDAPMWGIQFHPERTLEEGNKNLDARKQRDPSVRILGREIAEKVFDRKIAQQIFKNFLLQITQRGK